MLIGLTGRKGAGKDVVGAYLVKMHQFERKSFADSLKKSVSELFNIPFRDIERYKNDDLTRITLTNAGGVIRDLTFRQFLQYYGTESHRDVFGDNFWVDQVLPHDGFYAGRKIVITDCRFKSEAERIRALGGFVVRINKNVLLFEKDHHRSEVQSNLGHIEYEIENNGPIGDLYIKTERMLIDLGTRRVEL